MTARSIAGGDANTDLRTSDSDEMVAVLKARGLIGPADVVSYPSMVSWSCLVHEDDSDLSRTGSTAP